MSGKQRGSGSSSAKATFDRTVAEAVRRTKHAASNDAAFVPPVDDLSFILAVRSFASRSPATAARHTLTIDSTHLTGGSYDGTADVTIATDATHANTPGKIVARDGSGNFDGNVITAVDLTASSTVTTADLTSTGTATLDHVTAADIGISGNITATSGIAAFQHVTADDLMLVTMPRVNLNPAGGAMVATHTIQMNFNGTTYNVLLHS